MPSSNFLGWRVQKSWSKMDGLISHHYSTEELNLQGHVAADSDGGISVKVTGFRWVPIQETFKEETVL